MGAETIGSPLMWAGFIGFVLVVLALDLGIFHRKAHVVGFREAAGWSAVWVALALAFGGGVWAFFGPQAGMEYLTGYVIEKSLSIDNIFVFVVVFSSLKIPALYQHRVLYWGILSALVLRAGMIIGGAAALERFHWLVYIFGAFLLFTGGKLLFTWRKEDDELAPADNKVMAFVRRFVPTTEKYDGTRFFTRIDGRMLATPLFLALVLIEVTDVIFALDSIPAIFAVTMDPFLVFTSNIFAILGLRSLFFLLAGMVDRFRYLKVGLAGVLMFVGAKLALIDVVKISPGISLAAIFGMLGTAIVTSLLATKAEARGAAEEKATGTGK